MHLITSKSVAISMVPTQVQHAQALALLVRQNREYLQTYLPAVAQLATTDDARAYLEAASLRTASGELLEWHVFSGTDLCGSVRIRDIDLSDRNARMGYYVGSRYQGQGIASAAVRAALVHGYEHMQLNRIELHCAAGNLPSIALAERLGFRHEGVLRQGELLNGVFVDLHVYGLLQAEFSGR